MKCFFIMAAVTIFSLVHGNEESGKVFTPQEKEQAYQAFRGKTAEAMLSDLQRYFFFKNNMVTDELVLSKEAYGLKYNDIFKEKGLDYLAILESEGDLAVQDRITIEENKHVRMRAFDKALVALDKKVKERTSYAYESLFSDLKKIEGMYAELHNLSLDALTADKWRVRIAMIKNAIGDKCQKEGMSLSLRSFLFRSYTTKIIAAAAFVSGAAYAVVQYVGIEKCTQLKDYLLERCKNLFKKKDEDKKQGEDSAVSP